MPTTSPDNIFYEDTTTTYGDATNQALQSQSVQSALDKREGYNFVWAIAADRTAQTGMVQGSTGYQIDTQSLYVFDAGSWRLQLSYADFSSPLTNTANGSYVATGTYTINTGTSSDTNFVTASGNLLTLVRPGIYSLSVFAATAGAGLTGQSNVMVCEGPAASLATQLTRGYFDGGLAAMAALPFYRSTAANQVLSVWIFDDGAATQVRTTARIGRLG